MPLTELVVVEGGFAVAYLLAIGALALGVIAVTPGRLTIARNCFWASCAIFAGIAIMWGITTDYSFWPRTVIAGALGAIAAIAAVEATRFITHEQKESHPNAETSSAHPLKRLIVYRAFDPIVPWAGTESKFHGYNITVQNIGDDTITARLMSLNADIDGIKVLAITDPGVPVIIQQTAATRFQAWRNDQDFSIQPLEAKAIIVEFEIDYDTIPESGIRRSYRKIIHNLNWANGKNSNWA